MNTDKRYIVYGWDDSAQTSYLNDYGIDLCDALEQGRRDVMGYGDEQGQFNTEDEANICAMKYADSHRYSDIVSIYDRNEREWFN